MQSCTVGLKHLRVDAQLRYGSEVAMETKENWSVRNTEHPPTKTKARVQSQPERMAK
jgi:hypothetical protein